MANQEVTVKAPQTKNEAGDKVGAEATINYDLGDNLDEAIEAVGAEVVFSQYSKSAIIDLQAVIRRKLEEGKNTAEIQAIADEWKPGIKAARSKMSAKQKLLKATTSMTEEQLAEFIQEMQAARAEAEAAPAE